MKLIVTGGCGFIGSNFIRYYLEKYSDAEIVNVDKLTYAGNLENLKDLEGEKRYSFVRADISDYNEMERVLDGADGVINFAAESHVDRSIMSGADFIATNINGTYVLLDVASKKGVKRFLQISTDEVYGSLGPVGVFTETSPLEPSSVYSASKCSADHLVYAFHKTHGLDTVITRCSNNYGPFQFPEKLIPLIVTNAMNDQPLPVYGDGKNIRDWIHVLDHCKAIDAVFAKGKAGGVYNIGSNNEWTNIDIVKKILEILDKPESLIKYVEDRLGHDRRYAMDNTYISSELGWEPEYGFEKGLSETVAWYVSNRGWWEKIKSGEYLKFYEKYYGSL